MAESKNLLFFEISPFGCILSQSLDPIFGISVKLRIFYTHKVIFWRKKFQTLLSGFDIKKFHKNKARAETTQNNEKRLFYFSLRFQTRIHFRWARCRFQNHSTLLYTVQKSISGRNFVLGLLHTMAISTYVVIYALVPTKFQTCSFGPKKFHKNQSRAETTQNNEKRLFYFSLRFQTRIHF